MLKNSALIVEDDQDVAELIQLAVEVTLGCTVIRAENGETALLKAREHQPDFILLDWIMPQMSGLQALEELKADAATADTPVYMITRKSTVQDARKALEVGADGYFIKPVDFEKLCNWLAARFPALAESL
jgi:two-component system phosphate regulon response regulator PhoB